MDMKLKLEMTKQNFIYLFFEIADETAVIEITYITSAQKYPSKIFIINKG